MAVGGSPGGGTGSGVCVRSDIVGTGGWFHPVVGPDGVSPIGTATPAPLSSVLPVSFAAPPPEIPVARRVVK